MWPLPLTVDIGMALLSLDLLEPKMVGELAVVALQEGFDSHTIRHLAGLLPGEPEDSLSILKDGLTELEIQCPPPEQAARILARAISQRILASSLDPFEGASILAQVSLAVGMGFHELDAFVYVDSEAQERPQDRDFFAHAIKDEATRWSSSDNG